MTRHFKKKNEKVAEMRANWRPVELNDGPEEVAVLANEEEEDP